MPSPDRTRILVVDDEEAILETMTFTFEDDYDVLTSSSATKAIDILAENDPVAVVISDQRMPEMSGVEFLAQVFERHPHTTRIILTGFADMDATIGAINDGHVYAYVTKPWEPDQLKQVVRRAADHHRLSLENDRLLSALRGANAFLEAVVDELDTGALAVDAEGSVRASNRIARQILGLEHDPRDQTVGDLLRDEQLAPVATAVELLSESAEGAFEEIDLPRGGSNLRLRLRWKPLGAPEGEPSPGRVLLIREISHEPLRRDFEDLIQTVAKADGSLRDRLDAVQKDLRGIAEQARSSPVQSPGMAELGERALRTATAVEQWLAVDESLVRESYPDAQRLRDRMRMAQARWPMPDQVPPRVQELARRVEAYYESGDNPRTATL